MFAIPPGLGLLVGCGMGLFVRSAVFHHAVPAGSPPRRECPACGRLLLPYGTLVPRPLSASGRCPSCRGRIGPPPGLPEALTAAAVAVTVPVATPAWTAPLWCWLAVFGTALALVDLTVHRLPDALTFPAAGGLVVMLAGIAAVEGRPGAFLRALLAAAILGAVHLALGLTGRIGMGDAKLAVVLGLVLGWSGGRHILVAELATLLLAGTHASALLATGRAQPHDTFAFGPFILAGTALTIAIGGPGSTHR
ncbi:prepilin peptidase [Yinghuangia sp. ASG 101]|uniref:prepilin peptidase n=1 Tax=Yinghuangia sp. ASG 101 TaxID=2896848 RepID=UPI0022B22A60|nr:A24 family peptidase [Yinghuangia sp. ASG 101]